MAYCSSAERPDVMRMLLELAQCLDEQTDAQFLDALLLEREPGFADEMERAVARHRAGVTRG